MDNQVSAKEMAKQKRIKRIKRKLLPSIMAGFSLPFTLFLFGPFDLFAQNRGEFLFTLYDFLIPCVLITLVFGILLSAIALMLRKKAYSLYLALLFWCSVMLFIQGNYLNFGLTSLAGDGVSASASKFTVIVNTAIWLLSLGVTIFLVLKFKIVRKKLRSVVSLGLALVIVMEVTGVIAVSFKEDVYSNKETVLYSQNNGVSKRVLTTEGLTTLSDRNNVVVFVVDRFDARYYTETQKKAPQIFEELEGFTYYNNHITMYARTFPAVTHMLTGVENDYSKTRLDYFKQVYKDAEPLRYMKEQGYGVNVYTDSYYSYDNASYMAEYTDNITSYTDYEVTNTPLLVARMVMLSLYRYLPFAMKGMVDGISTDDFSNLVEFKSEAEFSKYSTDNKTVYDQMTQKDFELSEDGGRFSFINVAGCHMPSKYDSEWNELSEKSRDAVNVMTQSFKIINRYISEMKRLGVYEDATIIITGDHAAAMTDKKPLGGARVTAMLVKPSGVGEGELLTSSAPTCHDDIWQTIFDSEGLEPLNQKGITMIGADENAPRERRYMFHLIIDGDNADELEYTVTGDAKDFDNWKIVNMRDIHGVYD